MEEWRAIEGTNGMYEVSNTGKVRSNNYEGHNIKRELKQNQNRDGYMTVYLYFDGKRKFKQVHRLVAAAFLDNPDRKEQVNHINCVKSDNRVENLEWSTRSENIKHAYRNGLIESSLDVINKKKQYPVVSVNIFNGEVNHYQSVGEAEKETGATHANEVMKRKSRQSKGYLFYALNDYEKMAEEEIKKDMVNAKEAYQRHICRYK